MNRHPPRSTLFPSTPLSRSCRLDGLLDDDRRQRRRRANARRDGARRLRARVQPREPARRSRRQNNRRRPLRSEEHTSELQSPCNLVCRLLLEKKKSLKLVPVTPPHPVSPRPPQITRFSPSSLALVLKTASDKLVTTESADSRISLLL